MATAIIPCPFRALLSELADLEPRHGFQLPADVQLTAAQVATVCEHEPDTMADALVDMLPALAAQLRIVDLHRFSYDGIAATVINALTAAAQRAVLRELICYCDNRRLEAQLDRAYEAAGRPLPALSPYVSQGGC